MKKIIALTLLFLGPQALPTPEALKELCHLLDNNKAPLMTNWQVAKNTYEHCGRVILFMLPMEIIPLVLYKKKILSVEKALVASILPFIPAFVADHFWSKKYPTKSDKKDSDYEEHCEKISKALSLCSENELNKHFAKTDQMLFLRIMFLKENPFFTSNMSTEYFGLLEIKEMFAKNREKYLAGLSE